jgi:ABC-type glycerol-3-phosphate transport system substrate-binding protein
MVLALTRTKNRRMRLATALAGIALLILAGCGGDSKPVIPGLKGLGTPAGTSAVIVTATSASGGATATSTINLTVQ